MLKAREETIKDSSEATKHDGFVFVSEAKVTRRTKQQRKILLKLFFHVIERAVEAESRENNRKKSTIQLKEFNCYLQFFECADSSDVLHTEQHSNRCFDERRRRQTSTSFNMTEQRRHRSLLVITQPKITSNMPVIMLNKHGVYKVQRNKIKGYYTQIETPSTGISFLNLSSVKYRLWQRKTGIGFEPFVRRSCT